MIKEELETREKLKLMNIAKDWLRTEHSEGNVQSLVNLILSFTESREKQIQIDAEQIRALQKQNGELTDELTKKSDTNHQLIEQMAELNERCSELEAQIEKMKWHDLQKDPSDLPKDYKTMCICLSDFGSRYEPIPQVCIGYCDSLGWSDYMGSSLYSTVRYWCELPQS